MFQVRWEATGGFLNTGFLNTLPLPFYLLDVSLERQREENKEEHKLLSWFYT